MTSLSGLDILFPDDIPTSSVSSLQGTTFLQSRGGSCLTTSCSAKTCPAGFRFAFSCLDMEASILTTCNSRVGNVDRSPMYPGEQCDRLVCCPNTDVPATCTCTSVQRSTDARLTRFVIGRGGNTSPCTPSCLSGEKSVATSACAFGGSKALCCDRTTAAVTESCKLLGMPYSCSSLNASLPDTFVRMLQCPILRIKRSRHFADYCHPVNVHLSSFKLRRKTNTRFSGDVTSQQDTSCSSNASNNLSKHCPATCPPGQFKPFCCSSSNPPPIEKCRWVGTAPLCK
jgi:hypothetical protein